MVTHAAPPHRPTPIVAVECDGDHRAMGVSQGRARRESLARLQDAVFELMEVPLEGGLRQVARGAGRVLVPAASAIARRVMQGDLKQHYPRQYDRTAGIALGGGVPMDNLFLGPGVELMLNRLSYRLPSACTALAVTGGRARGGEPMIVKNFDYPDAARDTYLARISRPRRAELARSIDVTAAPLAGSHEGVNDRGLAVAYNYGHFAGQAAARVPITNLVQELLERCGTVDEVVAHIRRRPRAGAAIFMVADAGGEVASIEVAPDHATIRRAADHGDTLVHANHAVHPDMLDRDVPRDAVYSRWNPKPLRGLPVHRSSLTRHGRAEALLAAVGEVSERDLVAIARDHADGEGDDTTLCRHGPYYQTTCSVVLFPQRRTLKIMFGAPCQDDYSVISL
jgi:hypothetical protein